jgi:oxaloacetate decarboxylase (Na+ extruding) subunit alpha
MRKKKVMFYDTTIRDGVQSLWAMNMTTGMFDAVAGVIDQAGYSYIELPVNAINAKMQVRFLKDDPWRIAHLFGRKITKTKKSQFILEVLDFLEGGDPRAMTRLYYKTAFKATGAVRSMMMANTRNELDRYYPWVVPMVREMGLEFAPMICYYPGPRSTDAYYANVTRRVVNEYKPDALWLKDAGGLLTVERIKTLLPAMLKAAKGVPIDLHTHGMSTNQGQVVVEAMKLGINGVHTCIPPLASGSSHVSIYNAMQNAKVLGLEHNITDVEALQEAERRLRIIGKTEGLPEGVPLEYDHSVYTHQVPGGVISNLKTQLGQLGIAHKLDEVLDEIVRIIADLGYPIMITPMSQFVVSQAAVNVATGERYKELLDAMIEIALGVWGWEDAGVPWMDPEIKDRFLSHPNAKNLKQRYEKRKEIEAAEGNIGKIRTDCGMTHASDEEFLLYYIMKGDAEIKQIQPPRSYYTGKEPLVILLKELSKDKDISRLHMHRGNSFFEFRQT